MDYNFADIKEAYKRVGIEKGMTVLLKTDLRYLGAYDHPDRNEVLYAHLGVLSDLIDFNEGTLVVSTSSSYLCNTETPFDLEKSPSERGALTEYIRQQEGAVRSFHPFMSYAAIGKHAHYICDNVARHAYGPESPKARMLEINTMYLSLGLEPRFTCTVIHHIEQIMGVPYRYTKEFCHPVVRDKDTKRENFYLYVTYRDIDIKKNRNINVFQKYYKSGYTVQEAALGRGKVYRYSLVDFCNSTVEYLKGNIYGLLDEPPDKRPYTK